MTKQKHGPKSQTGLGIYFQKLKSGDRVAVTPRPSLPFFFPKRIIGLTGLVMGVQGRDYIVEIKEMGKNKKFIIMAAHLKKIKA